LLHGTSGRGRTITVGGLLRRASKLTPKQAVEALEDKGIDLDERVQLSANPEIRGALAEIEKHEKGERNVVSLE